MENLPRVSAIILAGGQSRRMGRDKAFIEFAGAPLIQHVLACVQPLCAETIIVANDPDAYARFSARVVADAYPGKGSLGGIFSGLQAAREPYALAVACDMPFLNADLLCFLISLAPQFDVVIPRAPDPSGKTPRGARSEKDAAKIPHGDQPIAKESNLHPLHAIYSKKCLASIEARLQADDLRMIGFHADVRVRIVEPGEVDRFDPEHWSFFNMNTPEDLGLARSLGAK
ncbi:MAG: molybdenum cofactor guanylyltransferase [Chloroflexi bacterium]|nr:molybdenum cofactor guanylyltransferase [Chloroflexota bacterium]